ncbi:hypothetical protein CA13_38720 [Planctomycetes bacterium CA13]|uniref:DUF721 domain-containing protein n=1 Tax=Novipirellula herctigrandis TaxID=2527986 RepID=A0A5C5Z4U0_9BACT|nr:hypothetical protein CA13_38720 [Planctomycetes bacterium CA13]
MTRKPNKPKSSTFQGAKSEAPQLRQIGSLVNQLISRRGYAQVAVVNEIEATIVGEIAESIRSSVRVGNLKRGVLNIYASDSVTLQELNFQKRSILEKITKQHPQSKVVDLKFRIQAKA